MKFRHKHPTKNPINTSLSQIKNFETVVAATRAENEAGRISVAAAKNTIDFTLAFHRFTAELRIADALERISNSLESNRHRK